ncbi:hypothetical protein MPSEU_000490100 [Mayamaea pseudoterrestris]|nr:hypothetical protein MPSEU_000490100 [Mayamaea pseudoterrestris]
MSRPNKRKEAPLPMPDDVWGASTSEIYDSVLGDVQLDHDHEDEKQSPRKRASTNAITIDLPRDFNHLLFQLLVFKADTGNFHATKEEQPLLHSFLYYIKKEFKNYQNDPTACDLTADQIKVLEHLHVPLTSRGDDHWVRFYDLLVGYREKHGHVLVPRLSEVPGLGDWVTDMRRQYKALKQGQVSQLTDDRRAKLEQLGFVWQVRSRPEWDARYKQLVDYKAVHGDCKVPQHYKENRALGKWTAKQREQYKKMKKGEHSFLTPYRLEKLEQLGFSWQIRTSLDPDDAGEFPALHDVVPVKVETNMESVVDSEAHQIHHAHASVNV